MKDSHTPFKKKIKLSNKTSGPSIQERPTIMDSDKLSFHLGLSSCLLWLQFGNKSPICGPRVCSVDWFSLLQLFTV